MSSRTGPLDRVRSAVSVRLPHVSREGVRRRALRALDLTAVARAEERVASLEVAVAENAQLAVGLARQVDELERAVVEVVERVEARRMGS